MKRILKHLENALAEILSRLMDLIYGKNILEIKTDDMEKIDDSKITDIVFDGVDMSDYPDFCDAYISSAKYDGKEMTDGMRDELNDDRDFVYDKLMEHLH